MFRKSKSTRNNVGSILLPPASEGWGKVLFSVCQSTLPQGGVPHLRSRWGGYSIPGLDRGEPHPMSGWGGTPSKVCMRGVPHPSSGLGGVPHPRSGWEGGTPSQVWPGGYPMGWGTPQDLGWGTPWTMDWVPSPRPGMGYPLGPGMGYPLPQTWDGVPSPQTWDGIPPQHSEHLLRLRGGWYASCVHAGGLSCFKLF